MAYNVATALGYASASTEPVVLVDADPVVSDADDGDYFFVSLGAIDRTINLPLNLPAGKRRVITFEIQHNGNAYDFGAGWDFGADGPPGAAPAGTRDLIVGVWNGASLLGSFKEGYA